MLTCLGRGLPTPEIEWQSSNGTKLTSSYVTHKDGVVTAHLMRNETRLSDGYKCVVVGERVTDSKTVQIEASQLAAVTTSVSLSHTDSAIKFTLRLNGTNCNTVSDQY